MECGYLQRRANPFFSDGKNDDSDDEDRDDMEGNRMKFAVEESENHAVKFMYYHGKI